MWNDLAIDYHGERGQTVNIHEANAVALTDLRQYRRATA